MNRAAPTKTALVGALMVASLLWSGAPGDAAATPVPSPASTDTAPGTNGSPAPQPTAAPTEPAPTEPAPTESGTGRTSGQQESPSERQRIEYRGLQIDVPASWAVRDLAQDPATCVRFDVNAVYLGTPTAAQACPVRVVGRTDALWLMPRTSTNPVESTLPVGSAPEITPAAVTAGELSFSFDGVDVDVVASLGADPAFMTRLLQSATATTSRPPDGRSLAEPRTQAQAIAASLPAGATTYQGLGFDACTAPSTSSMRAWLASPYRAIGVYIGGISRGCAQPNLTAAWVAEIYGLGWRPLPLYVGRQAPCSAYRNPITPGLEDQQGREAADDAAARAAALGLPPGSDVYFDMESYPRGGACSASVRAFLNAWTVRLHEWGYQSGVYSSAATGMADLVQWSSSAGFSAPDKIWFARWNGAPTIYGDPSIPDDRWAPYRRIHQFLGGHDETHGGVTINIDSDVVDTDPTRGNPFGAFNYVRGAPGQVQVKGWVIDPDTTAPTDAHIYIDGSGTAVRADLPHGGVGATYPGYGDNHGFEVSIPATPGPHTVCTFAINTAGPGENTLLLCQTVNVPGGNPFGAFNYVRGAPGQVQVKGWVIDPDTTAPTDAHIYIDGSGTAVRADLPHGGVGATYPGYGDNHGFEVSIPATPGPHTVCTFAINTAGPGENTLLLCQTVNVPGGNPFGAFNYVRGAPGQVQVKGWVIDPDTTAPTDAHIYIDGSGTAVRADLPHGGVGATYPGYGDNHGFEVSIPATPGPHTVCTFAINTAGPGENTLLLCQAVNVG